MFFIATVLLRLPLPTGRECFVLCSGWCESGDDCYDRSKTTLGSSTTYPATAGLGGGYFDQDPAVNPMM
jgi:hypothetical protein